MVNSGKKFTHKKSFQEKCVTYIHKAPDCYVISIGEITKILFTPMLSPFGIIIRIRCLHHILSENKADWSIFPGAVQLIFLISPKYNVFQSTQAESTCTISFYVFIPMKINTIYLIIYEKFRFICIDKSYEVNWIPKLERNAARYEFMSVIDTFRENAVSVISQIKVIRNLDLV